MVDKQNKIYSDNLNLDSTSIDTNNWRKHLQFLRLQGIILCLWIEETMPYIRFRNVVEAHKKIPINTVVLPPLDADFKDATGLQGTRFIANIVVNKSKSSGQDLVTISRAPEVMKAAESVPSNATSGSSASDVGRVLQLEHNIRFLQEQHSLMLAGLHSEIDTLRDRNRELQFQLIFAKGTPSTPSSPDDEAKQKLFSISPKQINATPLQVEILEKELGELRLHVQEVDAKNAALTVLMVEQNGKLEQYEHTIATYQKQSQTVATPTPSTIDHEQQLMRKLDDADALIRRLRREKSDLKRDIAVATSATVTVNSANTGSISGAAEENGESKDGGGVYANKEYHRDGGGRSHHNQHRGSRYHHRSGGGNGQQHQSGNYRGNNGGNGDSVQQQASGAETNNWFPPLYQQPNYWTNSSRNSATNSDLPSPQNPPPSSSTLPNLQQQQQQQHHNQRRSGHNNNHNQSYGEGGANTGGGGGHKKYHNRGHHNRSGRGGNGGDKSN